MRVSARARWSAAGADKVEFEVSTNPGAPFGPLLKIASGGELSRFILALKVALAEQGGAATVIFDEIDRGVGGAVASAIGERLSRRTAGAGIAIRERHRIAMDRAIHSIDSARLEVERGTTRVELAAEALRGAHDEAVKDLPNRQREAEAH